MEMAGAAGMRERAEGPGLAATSVPLERIGINTLPEETICPHRDHKPVVLSYGM